MSPAAALLAAMATSAPSVVDDVLAASAARFSADPGPDVEPSVDDLLEIADEWPVLAAELAVVDAECQFLGRPDALTRRHLRRAQAALARTVIAHLNRNTTPIGATQ